MLFGGIAALLAALFALARVRDWRAVRRFRAAFRPQGKDLLLVTSQSPHWQAYIEDHWLPRWGDRAVVLDWSRRATWDEALPEVGLFRRFAGDLEFNPLAIFVPERGGSVRVVRFWRAFRDHKHGKTRTLAAAEARLASMLPVEPWRSEP